MIFLFWIKKKTDPRQVTTYERNRNKYTRIKVETFC